MSIKSCAGGHQSEKTAISDGKPMLTVDKEYATVLGICAFPRAGKSGDDEAVARLNARIKEKIEHHRKLRDASLPTRNPQVLNNPVTAQFLYGGFGAHTVAKTLCETWQRQCDPRALTQLLSH